ncbi:unnamed protein product [Knipowitschia caucasica]|uniref:Ubiquitin-like domain-containing protein n=1 Tax=Knipowitschia caucasica TaxID=637954 RepID=A0AAV2LRK9_KNICA
MYEVEIKVRGGGSFEVFLCNTTKRFKELTVEDLWDKVQQEKERYNSENYRLLFEGSILDEDDSLYETGIRNGSVIILESVRREPIRFQCSSGRRNSMDRLADFDVCVLQ